MNYNKGELGQMAKVSKDIDELEADAEKALRQIYKKKVVPACLYK